MAVVGRAFLVAMGRADAAVDIERGRHGELLAQGGAYAALWARQQAAARRGEDDVVDEDISIDLGAPAPAK